MIAFDNAFGGYTSNSLSLTVGHTTSGTNRLLAASIFVNESGGSDVLTGVTYAGVAMTLVAKRKVGVGNQWEYLYYLIAPASGTNNLVASVSASANIYMTSASYTGANQSSQPDSSANGTGSSPLTLSTTVVTEKCWLVSGAGNIDVLLAAGSNTTLRSQASASSIGDSNGEVLTGSRSLQWTATTGSIAGVIMSIAEENIPSASPSNSPSRSSSVSPSLSPSGSASRSESASLSQSESLSPSASGSASQSPSLSLSPSASLSESPSASVSPSASGSFSASKSLSPSGSTSPSRSNSASDSPSGSESASISHSHSESGSLSPSGSQSPSSSVSRSHSPSGSLSPSGSNSASASPSLPDNNLSVDYIEICYSTGYSDRYSSQGTRYDSNLYVPQGTTYTDNYDDC